MTSSAATINRVVTFLPRNTSRAPKDEHAARGLPVLGRAPELVGVDPRFNTPNGEPLRLARLRDRVVLLEFWTFACVNCQRTGITASEAEDALETAMTEEGSR